MNCSSFEHSMFLVFSQEEKKKFFKDFLAFKNV